MRCDYNLERLKQPVESLQSVEPAWQQKAAMFSVRGSASSRLMSIEVLHSTAGRATERYNYISAKLKSIATNAFSCKIHFRQVQHTLAVEKKIS